MAVQNGALPCGALILCAVNVHIAMHICPAVQNRVQYARHWKKRDLPLLKTALPRTVCSPQVYVDQYAVRRFIYHTILLARIRPGICLCEGMHDK